MVNNHCFCEDDIAVMVDVVTGVGRSNNNNIHQCFCIRSVLFVAAATTIIITVAVAVVFVDLDIPSQPWP